MKLNADLREDFKDLADKKAFLQIQYSQCKGKIQILKAENQEVLNRNIALLDQVRALKKEVEDLRSPDPSPHSSPRINQSEELSRLKAERAEEKDHLQSEIIRLWSLLEKERSDMTHLQDTINMASVPTEGSNPQLLSQVSQRPIRRTDS